jgi:hypothetical protein
VWPVVIAVVLPLAQLLVEQMDVVGDAVLVQELVELFVIHAVFGVDRTSRLHEVRRIAGSSDPFRTSKHIELGSARARRRSECTANPPFELTKRIAMIRAMIDPSTAKRRFDRIERATDLPMAVLALLIVPALILEETAQSPGVRTFATVLNWIVWLAFYAEYFGKLAFAPTAESSFEARGSIC